MAATHHPGFHPAVTTAGLLLQVNQQGFGIVPQLIGNITLLQLREAVVDLPDDTATRKRGLAVFARRNLLAHPRIAELAASEQMLSIVRPIIGRSALAVRGILFDKNPDANWVVPWHQDLSIAVAERIDTPGFGPWSSKAGVPHVQPPVEVLRQMLTLRLHLDDCGEQNGPLRVIPGSHREILSPSELEGCVDAGPQVACCADAGGAVVMRPMLVHASSPSVSPTSRRVVHIEYAGCTLPGGLRWKCGGIPRN